MTDKRRHQLSGTFACASRHPLRRRVGTVAVALAVFAFSRGMLAETAAGIRWTAPSAWKAQGAAPMRAATYAISPAAGDPMPSECVVYFFGAGQGGSVEANIARWKGQFADASGKEAPAKIGTRTVHQVKMTTIDTTGMYSGLGGPTGPTHLVRDYRLLGAIVEAPGGNIFIKFTGPAKTIGANQQLFEQLLTSIEPNR
jgi:hypothetical protein